MWRNGSPKFTDFTHMIGIYKMSAAFTSTRTARSLSSPAQFLRQQRVDLAKREGGFER